jgi:hypothetical protein
MPKPLISEGVDNTGGDRLSLPAYDYVKGPPIPRTNHPVSQLPQTYTPASGDEELERLQELIAEAEELCIQFQVETYSEAQRSQGKIELLSKELEEMKERRSNRAAPQPEP